MKDLSCVYYVCMWYSDLLRQISFIILSEIYNKNRICDKQNSWKHKAALARQFLPLT